VVDEQRVITHSNRVDQARRHVLLCAGTTSRHSTAAGTRLSRDAVDWSGQYGVEPLISEPRGRRTAVVLSSRKRTESTRIARDVW